MARRAEKDFTKGVYQMRFKGNRDGKSHFELVFTTSLTKNSKGDDGMNCDLMLENDFICSQLPDLIKKHKITKAIWYSRNDYVTPYHIKKYGFELLII